METTAQEIIRSITNYNDTSGSTLKIRNKDVKGPLILLDTSYGFSITFQNCSFEYVLVNQVKSNKDLFFENCSFVDDLLIRGLSVDSLKFEHCNFEKSLDIDYIESNYLRFIKTESKNGINLTAGQIRTMTINPVNEKTHFTFIRKFLLIDSLSIDSVSGITVFAKDCIINKVYLSGYFNIGSRLDFSNIVSSYLRLKDLNNDGKIYFSNTRQVAVKRFINKSITHYVEEFLKSHKYLFRDSEVEYIKSVQDDRTVLQLIATEYSILDFESFIDDRYLEFLEYEPISDAELNIRNSSVGILEVKNINFDWRYKLDIQNSDLSSIKLINSKIPDIQIRDNYLNYYNVYNDLYTSASKQNNAKDKLEYYRISQRYLYQFLKYEAAPNQREIGARIAIFISNVFSSHGTNWLKAIIVTIIFAMIFFSLFVISLNGITVDLTWNAIFETGQITLNYLPQFINPLHKLDFMESFATLGSWTALVDLFSRIIIAIGLFEIVRSFRKHVRQ